jgi:hypothetical protein
MDKDLEITTALDQSLSIENIDILEEVEYEIYAAVRKGDADLAFGFCKRMIGEMKRSGIALAKALWMINKNWLSFHVGDEFEPTAQDYTGLHPHTIERYVKVWEMLANYVPTEFKNEIQHKNIRSLIPIANAVAQGYEIDTEVWEKLVQAPDYSEISKIVREDVKDESPRKNNLTLKVDNNGSIWAYNNNNVLFIGSLEVRDTNEIVKKAIERIINNSGMLRG